jgi:hypothetical protein
MEDSARKKAGVHAQIEENPKGIKRRCCCCCTCLGCTIFILIILIILTLTGFFLWPRRPEVEFMGMKRVTEPTINDSGIHGIYNAIVQVDNPNFISWTLDEVVTELFDAETERKMGSGHTTDIELKSRKVENITLPITLQYTANGENDTVVKRFSAICTGDKTPMSAQLKVTISVDGLSWAYKPELTKDITLTCPE